MRRVKNIIQIFENKRIELFIITLFISFYSLAAISVSLNRYWQFDAFWYDFGIFDENIWKLSRFQLPNIIQLQPPQGKIEWGEHLNPSGIFLAPFYWITNKQEIILIAQVIFVSLSALIAYMISRKYIHNMWVRISLIISYLGYVGIQNALYTDVHNVVFALLPFMLTIWALFNQKYKLYWLFFIITLGFQESLAGIGVGLGMYIILVKNKQIKLGISTILVSIIYGVLASKVIIPYFNHQSYNFQPVIPINWTDWITGLFIPINTKLRTIMLTIMTFGILPVFYLPILPLLYDHYLERFVLNAAGTRWDLGFHYNALIAPIMFLGAIGIIQIIQKTKYKKYLSFWALSTILLVFFLHRFYLHGPLMLATHPTFYKQTQNAQFLRNFEAKIPKNGLLMTQNNLAAHFTHGNTILLNEDYELIKPDYVAIDIRSGQNANNFFPLSEEKVKNLINLLKNDLNYSLEEINNSQLIFHRN